MDMIISVVTALSGIPVVGKVLAIVVVVAGALSGVATAVVAVWHALVGLLMALSYLPGIGSASQKLANLLSADEAKISDFEISKLLPILNRISAIPLPKS